MTTKTTTRREPAKPIFTAYCVSGEGRNAYWTRIGAVFAHDGKEGITLILNAYPINNRIVMLPPKEEDTHQPSQEA